MDEGARTLLVFAHPALERARANPALLAAASDLPGLTVRDLYELYPDFAVDVAAEQALLRDSDLIVLQFPLYWYSAPALLKEWQDAVWLHGFAYGARGCALRGKTLACAVTTGGPAGAFGPRGPHGHAVEELLLPFRQAAALCAMSWAPPFVLHDVALADDAALAREARRYRDHLAGLAAGAPLARAPSEESPA